MINPFKELWLHIRAYPYSISKGISYEEAVVAVDGIDQIEYYFRWDRQTCKEHMDYFIVEAKITDGRIVGKGGAVDRAFNTFAPRHVRDINDKSG